MNDDLESVMVAVYLIIVFELVRRAGPEVDRASKQMPRLLAEMIWSVLITLWPVAVPIGWLMIGLEKLKR